MDVCSFYSNEGLKAELTKYFGELKIKDAKTNIAITSCNMTASDRPYGHIFTKTGTDFNELEYDMVDVALATSAAPSFFPEEIGLGNR